MSQNVQKGRIVNRKSVFVKKQGLHRSVIKGYGSIRPFSGLRRKKKFFYGILTNNCVLKGF